MERWISSQNFFAEAGPNGVADLFCIVQMYPTLHFSFSFSVYTLVVAFWASCACVCACGARSARPKPFEPRGRAPHAEKRTATLLYDEKTKRLSSLALPEKEIYRTVLAAQRAYLADGVFHYLLARARTVAATPRLRREGVGSDQELGELRR